MKNLPFCHSVSPGHPFRKWMAYGLFAFIAGLTGIHVHAAPSSSGRNAATSTSSEARAGKQGPVLTARTPAAKNRTRNDMAAAGWQKRQPFSGTDISWSGNGIQEKPAWIHHTRARTAAWHHMAMKPDTAITDTGIHAVPSTSHTPDVFQDSLRNSTDGPAKTAFTGSDGIPDREMATKPAVDGTRNRGYSVGPARFTVNYEKANDRNHEKMTQLLTGNATYDMTGNDIVESRTDRDNIHLGMEYATDNGRINAAVNVVRMKDLKKGAETGNPDSADLKTFMIGYTYDISDRTSLYGMVARTEYDKEALTASTRGSGNDEDSVTGFRLGMTHRF